MFKIVKIFLLFLKLRAVVTYFYSASSIDYSGKTYTDLCVDEKYLLEYVCDTHPAYNGDDNIEVFLYKCPSGCDQGTCIGEYTE